MKQWQQTFDGYAIGIDIGGSKIEVILSKEHPLNIITRIREDCEKYKGYQHLLQQIHRLINECIKLIDKPSFMPSIGIGIPGSINPQSKLVRNCNITILNGKALQEDLSAMLHQAITIENDANCFTLSESILGAGKGYNNILGVIIGTGLGGGLVINQKIYMGKNGYAAELGHTSIDYDGIPCWCGNKGCVENYLSGTGIERIYQLHSQENIKTPEIYQRYLQKEVAALETFKEYFIYFGRALANFIYMFNPDIIILGGGVSQIPLLYDEGKNAVQQHFTQEPLEINIVKNELGDSSGVFGALLRGLPQ